MADLFSALSMLTVLLSVLFFFFNDTATTEIYTLSLHDALPISLAGTPIGKWRIQVRRPPRSIARSEEHTSELQSRENLVCRLLLEKKKTTWHLYRKQEEPDLTPRQNHSRPPQQRSYAAQFPVSLFVGEDKHPFFFFNDTATTEIYTLSLHDALPI